MYKYAIIINNIIIELTNNMHAPIKYAKIKYPSAKYIPLANENDILNGTQDKSGIYIISDIYITKIYEKKIVSYKGFIFNNKKYVIRLITTLIINEINASVKQYKNIIHVPMLPCTIKPKMYNTPKIENIAKISHILSIGNNNIKHIEFIDMILNNILENNNISEDNIIIVSNNCSIWYEKHQLCVIFEYSDDVLAHIYENHKNIIIKLTKELMN